MHCIHVWRRSYFPVSGTDIHFHSGFGPGRPRPILFISSVITYKC